MIRETNSTTLGCRRRRCRGRRPTLSNSYLDATFREFSGYLDLTNPAAGTQDLSGNRIPQSPRHKLTVSVLNHFDLGGGASLTPVATVNYTSAQYFSPFTTDVYRSDGYVRADFRLVYETGQKIGTLQQSRYGIAVHF